MINENFQHVLLNHLWIYLDYESLIELGKSSKEHLKIIENLATWKYLLARDYCIKIGKYNKEEHYNVIKRRNEKKYESLGCDMQDIIESRTKWQYDEREDYDLRENYDSRENYEFMRYVLPDYSTFIQKENLSLCCSECRCWGETDDPCFWCVLCSTDFNNDQIIVQKLQQAVFKAGTDLRKCQIKPGDIDMFDKNYYEIKSYDKIFTLSGSNIYDIILQLLVEHARYNGVTITHYIRQMIRIIYFEQYGYGTTINHYGEYKKSINTFINLLEVLRNEWCGNAGCFKIIDNQDGREYDGKIFEIKEIPIILL